MECGSLYCFWGANIWEFVISEFYKGYILGIFGDVLWSKPRSLLKSKCGSTGGTSGKQC